MPMPQETSALVLTVTLDVRSGGFGFVWFSLVTQRSVATGFLSATDGNEQGWLGFDWTFVCGTQKRWDNCAPHPSGIRALMKRIANLLPLVSGPPILTFELVKSVGPFRGGRPHIIRLPTNVDFWKFLTDLAGWLLHQTRMLEAASQRSTEAIATTAMWNLLQTHHKFTGLPPPPQTVPPPRPDSDCRKPTTPRGPAGKSKPAPEKIAATTPPPPPPAPPVRELPTPSVPVRMTMPTLAFQETALPITGLSAWRLAEQAAQWWISNQSDTLLSLPFCRIQKLEYQTRTALRILGPLRGRALLSDEVGLGKTIEAGLVLKEWLTRGMVKRFLILTVPSLVDQWEEELRDKFNLTVATTNHAAFRSGTAEFWRANAGIVASLHTLKQPAQLEVARAIHWDLVIVDEAHYLRNRESQAWQAVNALPRQFLLLLTATPVQNSLEELYNLVTLLQPGQLPTPKEFRARFLDPKKPRQPREPEELRRLLGQVMIRNTRANAGIQLPPRRAETIVFETNATERAFWESWETELRAELAQLPAAQSSLWGRLLLQAAGSSPAAWLSALEKFPSAAATRRWRDRAPLTESWQKKSALLPPLAQDEGGVVIFTQFLDTQAALAASLRAARVPTFVVNGATPAAERQPITEEFRRAGGALLLTHSGTEGRNLQFCHRLVNFDLPWNPMEIEQRIGRLHRLGQKHPVRIYNLVQAGTLQEHLLQILQEKLNLFELVVGETGLVLGERFGSDEFAEEILRRWRESDGQVGEALKSLGEELASARDDYQQVKALDATLFAKDYETL